MNIALACLLIIINKFERTIQTYIMKNSSLIISFFLIYLIGNLSVYGQESKKYMLVCAGFYNLENLFDYEDDPTINDEEFLPEGKNQWDSTRYHTKLNHMAQVISEIGTDKTPDGAAFMGVCEIENRRVLEDLVKEPLIAKRNYQIVHFDSPDKRGIDVGFLYQEKYFKYKKAVSYELNFPYDPDYKTRSQLVVTGSVDGEDVSVIVTHWPSRSGGQSASQPNRIEAAKLGRRIIDSLLTDNPSAKIILMGDLNDDPNNVSVEEYIKAKGKKNKLEDKDMYNTMYDHFKKGLGTLAYRDAWNLFDQIIISQSFLDEASEGLIFRSAHVYNQSYMVQQFGNYKDYPLRTFAGGEYTNGYSDHFPTYIFMIKEVK